MTDSDCGCPDGYPAFREGKWRHTGPCLLFDETLAEYETRRAKHEHEYVAYLRCKVCGREQDDIETDMLP